MFNKKSKLIDQVAALPEEGKEALFHEALNQDNSKAVEIILTVGGIKSEVLTKAFYGAATSGTKTSEKKKIAKLLVSQPETDVNWINTGNWSMTPAIRAGENKNDEIMDMIMDRDDFNPNVVTVMTNSYVGIPYDHTVITKTFGYNLKDVIKKPKEGWKQRLLNDKRVDWNLQADLIAQAQAKVPLYKEKEAKMEADNKAWRENRDALETKLAPVRIALGLPRVEDDYF